MSKAFDEEMYKISDFLQIATSSEKKNTMMATLLAFRNGIEESGAADAAPLLHSLSRQRFTNDE